MPSLSFVEALRKTARDTEVKVLHVAAEKPSVEIGSLLQLEPGEKAKHAIRLRSIDGTLVMITDAWLPPGSGQILMRFVRERYSTRLSNMEFARGGSSKKSAPKGRSQFVPPCYKSK